MNEIKRRIMVAVWAYAYEVESESMVPDNVFDEQCLLVNPEIRTGREPEDTFFATEFAPDTGVWIHKHPDLPGVCRIYNLITGRKSRPPEPVKVIEEAPRAPSSRSNWPEATNFGMMCRIASYGFAVVPGVIFDPTFGALSYEFSPGEAIHITQMDSGMQKTIFFHELYAQ